MLELLEEKKLLTSFPKLAKLGYSFFSLTITDQQFLITLKEIPYSIFRFEEALGSGDNGYAYRAIDVATGTVVAIKNSNARCGDAFHITNASMLTRTVESQHFNLKYLENRACGGAKLALEVIGNHPSITRVFHTGIGLSCHELNTSYDCYNTPYSVLEYAHKLDAMDKIYPDLDRILKIITDFYDAQRHFLELGVGFEDNNYGNFLFSDGRIKYTDFESNIVSWNRPPKDSMYCRMFISMRQNFFRRFWPNTPYNLTYNNLFDSIENDFIELCKNEKLCQQRDEFLSHMRNSTYHFSLALCQDRGQTQNSCENQFSFFANPHHQRNNNSLLVPFFGSNEALCQQSDEFLSHMRNSTYHFSLALCQDRGKTQTSCKNQFSFFENPHHQKNNNSLLVPFFGSIAIQIFRDLLKKQLSSHSINNKIIDHGINISLIAIMLKTQDSVFPVILSLMNQGLITTGVLSSRTSSLLTTIISFTAGTISAYANGDYSSAYSFAKDLSTSTASSLLGVICHEGIKKINQQIDDPHFARSAPCTIL